MKLKSIKQVRVLTGKRVLLRLDLNVPLENLEISPEGAWRLERAIPTIKYLLLEKAKVIIVAHLGRPAGRKVRELSLQPVAEYLSRLIKKKIEFWSDDFRGYYQDSLKMDNASIAMLENIRFEAQEKKGSLSLAKDLSNLADIYVNDAFGNIHRTDTSMLAITKYLPAYAGLLVLDEVEHLSHIVEAKQNLAIILGGAKIKTKIKLIKKFTQQAEVLLGGALASTMLKAQGLEVGKSLVDDKGLTVAKELSSEHIHLPLDVKVAKSVKARTAKRVTVDNITKSMMILDIGPSTVNEYLDILKIKKIIVWNGPLGYFENKLFVKGSSTIMKELAKSKAKVIIGGGETVKLVNQLKLHDKFTFVSTGGGAMLAFLEGNKLESLERLYA